jgi:long-chain acyl-CoA synthetase
MSTSPDSKRAPQATLEGAQSAAPPSGRSAAAQIGEPDLAPVAQPRERAGQPADRLPRKTICQAFQETVARMPDQPALMHKEGGRYLSRTYAELAQQVREFALGLADLGVASGDRVALLLANRPEWAIADLATLSLGAVTTPLYPSLPAAQVEYILDDAAAAVLILEDEKQWRKLQEIRDRLPALRHVLMVEPRPADAAEAGVLQFADVLARGRAAGETGAAFERRWRGVKPDDLASIIYTSGTTGEPKGAMLTHFNFMSNALGAVQVIDIRPDNLFLSFLPLSHVFERLAGYYLPLSVGATIAYAESVFAVQQNMAEVRPTIMASVPRLYESIHARILDTVAKAPPQRQRLFHWALRVGREVTARRQAGQIVGPLLALQHAVADRLVFRKIRERTGGRMRYFISGGAPLPRATAEFFTAVGLTILEGYGLTETSPVISVNRPGRVRLGTVGELMPGVEVRIAPDGEILTRGPHIMRGYFHKPEATRDAIDPEGWFHTGDIGDLDEAGYLRITDRKKDIIVLANGKNVAPQPIEAALKASPYIQEIALIGDKQPTITALVVPAFERLRAYAREHELPTEPEALAQHPEIRRLLKVEIDRHSGQLADFERIKRFTILDHEFSIDGGELTPTLKLKRRVIAEKYRDAIAAMGRGAAGD